MSTTNLENSWGIIPVAGKGHGLIAAVDIPKGTTILSEKEIFRYGIPVIPGFEYLDGSDRMDKFFESPSNVAWIAVGNAIAQLPQNEKDIIQNLTYHGKTEDRTYWRIRSNSFTTYDGNDPGTPIVRVYENISRANHTCKPNAVFSFNDLTGQGQLRSIREIRSRQEIEIDYFSNVLSPQIRKKYLHENYGFQCTCEQCEHASVRRSRRRADDLFRTLDIEHCLHDGGSACKMGRPIKNLLTNAKDYIEILNHLEVYGQLLRDAYVRSAQLKYLRSLESGDNAKTIAIGARSDIRIALNIDSLCQGEDTACIEIKDMYPGRRMSRAEAKLWEIEK
ncbi:hypothetical protein NA57DRAFT_58465 [Rhizodiscina lignyota]|uniref:SET domain-containing protein n=1 Tax=Rhizodiscina lignyota TaxID=1504668 RepID=A0A9P4IDI2_9PEZI|nr:hypothetical protein NA57DRAFT_58465 [Rhizodiscina lignyota]